MFRSLTAEEESPRETGEEEAGWQAPGECRPQRSEEVPEVRGDSRAQSGKLPGSTDPRGQRRSQNSDEPGVHH